MKSPLRILYCLLVIGLFSLSARAADGNQTQTILHILDYVSVDYGGAVQNGRVLKPDEYAEQLEFAHEVMKLVGGLPETEAKARFEKGAAQLVALIDAKKSGSEVSAAASSLSAAIVQAYQVVTAPKAAPDLARGAKLFVENCTACHGLSGLGDGALAASLQPKPTNFHDRERFDQRSVYSLYSTISLGVAGTAMTGYTQLSEQDRWVLAFYVGNFAARDTDKQAGATAWKNAVERREKLPVSLQNLTTLTPADAQKQYGDTGTKLLAYLKSEPQVLWGGNQESPLQVSTRLLHASLTAHAKGNISQAQQLAVSGYIEGYELVERQLDGVDKELKTRVEREMMEYRNLLKSGANATQLKDKVAHIDSLLTQVQERLDNNATSSTTNFVSAFVILLREGLEAILLIAGLAAFLRKTSRSDGLPYIHAGWIVALLAGVATWFIASHFIAISGASREMTEGITALVSAAVLLYVGYWLHDKSHAQSWQKYVQTKVKDALSGKTLWLLASLSFFAVYREVFETVLFYQALWVQVGETGQSSVVFGFGSAVLGLVLLAWLIMRFSVKLPLKLFFGVSSVIIAIMAVIFVGKGIAALQEAGKLVTSPVDFPTIPMLGIFPHLESLMLQAIVVVVIVAAYFYSNRSMARHVQ